MKESKTRGYLKETTSSVQPIAPPPAPQNHEAELEALKLRNTALQESIDGCAKKVLSLVQTRKELITLLDKVVNQAHLSHTERCTWEELNHGGDCDCAVGTRHYTNPPWPGLKAAIERTLEREKL